MRVGFVGWRGMVGSVLMDRMRAENDFEGLEPTFFSTSSPGGPAPDVGQPGSLLLDARDLRALAAQQVIVTCQGGEYTTDVYPKLRAQGWDGIWIDAASALRMDPEAMLVLDPVNGSDIEEALASGIKTFAGANCTVSLLLLAFHGLIQSGEVEWISTMSYQAASGAGAANLRELVAQMDHIGTAAADLSPSASVLELDRVVSQALSSDVFPAEQFGVPLAASAIPWIDCLVGDGQTREEWKSMAEANKLLNRQAQAIPIDGLCVRIGAMRCHAQAVTIKLRSDLPLDQVSALIDGAHPWTRVIPNDKESTLSSLTPAAVAGTLNVPVGRLRKMKLGPEFVTAFTVGDQLLWGAAEPLRRLLGMIRR